MVVVVVGVVVVVVVVAIVVAAITAIVAIVAAAAVVVISQKSNRKIDYILISKSSSNIRRNILISWRNLNATTRAEPTQNNTCGTRAKRRHA